MTYKKLFIGTALIIAACFLSYLPLKDINTFHIDDPMHLLNSPTMQSGTLKDLKDLWTKPHAGAFTPVTSTVWFFLTKIARDNTYAPGMRAPLNHHVYRYFNFLTHIACTLLVGLLLWLWTKNQWPSLFGALIFGLHPLHVEAISWITEFRGVLGAFFCLLCLVFYDRYLYFQSHPTEKDPFRHWKFYALALISCILAGLSKPTFLIIPALVGWIAYFHYKRPLSLIIKELTSWIILTFPSYVLQAPLNKSMIVKLLKSSPLYERIAIAFDTIYFYLIKLFFPVSLGFDYGRVPKVQLTDSYIWLYILIISTLGGIALYLHSKKRESRPLLLIGIFLLPLTAALGIVPFIYQHISTVADRYAYMSVFSLSLLSVYLWPRLQANQLKLIFPALLLCLYGSQTYTLTKTWQSNAALYTRVIEINPKSWLAHNNLAHHYESIDPKIASYHFKKAAEIGGFPVMYSNLGLIYLKLKDYPKAIKALEKGMARTKYPIPSFLNNLAIAHARQGKIALAKENFKEALKISPDLKEAERNLAALPPVPKPGESLEKEALEKLTLEVAPFVKRTRF